ncbi:GtrA family protein [Roseiarcaceae bacterium H3SJ34-1]|uniref:GtrA family protein n=1 Tax=Terripilifer ovatus TaxID=3032367 RepID=UPI003AB91D37|nr:GtrA family protein [Roseiarcaceae bacterium H3SJ34-1]
MDEAEKRLMIAQDRLSEVLSIARFAVVGLFSTLVYLIASFAIQATTSASSSLINLIAMTVSLVVSYFGHYKFTYNQTGRHKFFSKRFIAVTIVVFVMASILQFGVTLINANPRVSYIAVAIFYPVASFILNHFWTFLRGRAL